MLGVGLGVKKFVLKNQDVKNRVVNKFVLKKQGVKQRVLKNRGVKNLC